MAYYPWFFDKNFYKDILSKKEINDHRLEEDKVKTKCLEDYQYIVSNYINPESPYNSLLLYFSTGVGKCHGIDTEIMMSDGSIKKVQDIKTGEFLMGDDSGKRKVLSLVRGKDEMYEIVPVKGDKYVVNSEHILCLKMSGYPSFSKREKENLYFIQYIQNNEFKSKTFNYKNKIKEEVYQSALSFYDNIKDEQILEISVKDYLKLSKSKHHCLKGYKVPLDFPEKTLPLDPYMVGFWLGDGTGTGPYITTQDTKVLFYFRRELRNLNLMLTKLQDTYAYGISSNRSPIITGRCNECDKKLSIKRKEKHFCSNICSIDYKKGIFRKTLQEQNLIKNKHIPDIYKYNSRENRLKLLAGLIDSDGHLINNGFEFVQKNEKVMDDVIYLCRSLGFSCYKSIKKTSWTYKGIKKYGTAFRTFIFGKGIEEVPILCDRKKAKPRQQIKDVLVSGIKVKSIGKRDYYGFNIDGNKRYLLGDFTVTHNSFSSISIAENFIRKDKTKQVLVITKSKTLINNFISDLINICSAYATQAEVLSINSLEPDEKIKKLVKSRIKKNYTFITYNHLKDKKVDFTDKIVIIDEIHNLLGNTGYNAVMKSIISSKKYRLVLLSATPVYDNIADVFQLSNILNGKTSQFNTTNLSNYMIQEEYNQVGNIFKNIVNTLTKLGTHELVKRLTGKIFYLKVDKKNFPSVSYPKSVKTIGDKKLPIGVIPCMMSGIQEKYYTEAINYKVNSLGGQLESMSSIIYPDFNGKKYFGKAGMDLYIKGNQNSDFLLESNIEQYSCKLYKLLHNIKASKGKIYIHSNSITDDGAPLIAKCLRTNGYSKIAVLTSNSTLEFISKTIKAFNHPDNDNGEKINIIIGSGIISEGITLKSVRQAHIYEPEWNYSRIDQITGRVIRKGSHASLLSENRNVEVYLYCAISSNFLKSVDFAKYYLSSIKDLEIKKLERTLAKSAFSCGLTKSRNILKNKENGSRECDYQDCEYTCDNDPEINVDTSTYNVFLHDKELYNELAPKILKVFGKTNSISLKDLSKLTGISQEILINIMKNKPPVDVTYNSGIFSIKKSKLKTPEISKIVNKKVTTGSSSNVRGFINEAGSFLLEKNKGGKLSKKICTTGFDKQELISMVLMLNLELPQKPTKKSLCEVLSKHFS